MSKAQSSLLIQVLVFMCADSSLPNGFWNVGASITEPGGHVHVTDALWVSPGSAGWGAGFPSCGRDAFPDPKAFSGWR